MLVLDKTIDTKQLDQTDPAWMLARLGHITASCMDDVMAKGKTGEAVTRYKYKIKLLAERMTGVGQDSYNNAAMDWGKSQEQFAAQAYELRREILLDKTGFWRHPTIEWLGASPDRLAGDVGLVEIKCPNTSTHLTWMLSGSSTMPSEYVKQVQAQLWICEKEWCDFVSFDPRLPEKNQLHIIRVMRDEELIKKMEAESISFLLEVQDLINQLNSWPSVPVAAGV